MKNKKETKEGKKLKSFIVVTVIVLFVAVGYALLRYNIIKGVEFAHFPLYILNKGISLAAVILIGLSFFIGPLARIWPNKFSSKLYLRKYFGIFGFGLASIHTIMSLILFNPAYYPKFFSESGKLNLTGELSMLFGVLAFFIFSIVALTSIPSIEKSMNKTKWLYIQRAGYFAFLFVMFHVLIMGAGGWLKPDTWPGGLLPISLIAFLVILFVLLARVIVILIPKENE